MNRTLQPKKSKKFIRWAIVLLCCMSYSFAHAKEHSSSEAIQSATVSGTVLDQDNMPIPGANVILKGTASGTTTDANGKYTLQTDDQNTILVFSFIGYVTEEIPVGGRSNIDVTLTSDLKMLGEVVVVGYGVQKKSSLTGAVSQVNASEVAALPVASVENAIQGRVAGVTVTSNGGPGTNPNVRIRGIGSITGSSDPLYVVDGFPSVGNLNSFDTKDIESIEVLKDAAATAIYGSRGANGVIIVTTKKGSKDNKLHVNVDSYYGVQSAWKQLDLLKTDDYVTYGTTLLTNGGAALPPRFLNGGLDQPTYAGATQTYRQTNTDWQKEVFRDAPIFNAQVSLSSSSEKSKVYSSLSYFKQDGIFVGTNFERYSYRINYEHKISKVFTFGENLNMAYSNQKPEQFVGARSIIQHVIHSVPYMPVYDPTLDGGYRAPSAADASDPENPVRIANMENVTNNTINVLGNLFLEAKILDGLKYKFTLGINYSANRTVGKFPIFFDGFRGNTTNGLSDSRSTYFSPYISNQLSYDKTFGSHSINVVVVGEKQDSQSTYVGITGEQPTNAVNQLLGSLNGSFNGGTLYETTLLSYLGRINYEFKGKYLLSASIRRDGYSGFAPDNKWANFPGVSVGWRLGEEEFLKSIPVISDLKVRASYGSVGTNGGGAYDYQSFIGTQSAYPFNNDRSNGPGGYFDRLPNSQLTWEISKTSNVGFDLGLFGNRVTFSAEYFEKKTDGLLLDVLPTLSLGYSQATRLNIGALKNSGLELVAGYAKSTGDFTFNLSGNMTFIKNKVERLDNPTAVLYNGANTDFGGGNITRTIAGSSIQEFYGYVTDGIFQNQGEIDAANAINGDPTVKYQDNAAPGDIRFKDLNGDGIISADDQTRLGSYLPDFYYGLNFTANYKAFDVTLFLQGSHGNEIYNGTKVLGQGMLRLFGAQTDVLNAWTPTNTNTDIPRAVNGDPNSNTRTSNRFVEDGSYLRLKNVSIGYSIPRSLLTSVMNGSLTKVRFYLQSQNLFTITKYTGYDPEIGRTPNLGNSLTNGIDYGQYPVARTFLAGIQIGF